MGRPRFDAKGRQLAAGEVETGLKHVPGDSASVGAARDQADPTRPVRPCAKCGRRFQPTVKRKMLCGGCFKHAGSDSPFEPAA